MATYSATTELAVSVTCCSVSSRSRRRRSRICHAFHSVMASRQVQLSTSGSMSFFLRLRLCNILILRSHRLLIGALSCLCMVCIRASSLTGHNGGVIVKLDREIPLIGNSGARAALCFAVQHVVRGFESDA